MKNGVYIYPDVFNNIVGVMNKINSQIYVLKENFNIQVIPLKPVQEGVVNSIERRLPWGSNWFNWSISDIHWENISFIYIRMGKFDQGITAFLSDVRKSNPTIRIVIEIPTYPYDKEQFSKLYDFPLLVKDKIYRRKLHRFVDRIVTYSDDEYIFGIPTIRSRNGILIEKIQFMDNTKDYEDRINILAIGMFQKSHGYERVIMSLVDYFKNGGKRDVILHFVGDGDELALYKMLANDENVINRIKFYGILTGEELSLLYAKMDLALGCFGGYKRGLNKISSLKTTEALAYGLPVVTALNEDVFDKYQSREFCLEFPNDESNIKFDRIIIFYDELKKKYGNGLRRTIREFAEKTVDMRVVMQPVIDFFNFKNMQD